MISSPHVRRVAALMPLLTVTLVGCGSWRSARTAAHEASRTSSGAMAVTADCTPTNRGARLGRVAIAFTGASSGEAAVRIEGKSGFKSTVRVDVSTGTVLELDEGAYQLRVTLAGHRAVERAVTATCGKDSDISIPLSRR